MENEENINELKEERDYYKGFYEGVKEITTLIGDESININYNYTAIDSKAADTVKEKKVTVEKLEGEKAERFIKIMKELGVE